MKKRAEHLKTITKEQSRASWDYADALCAVLADVVRALRKDGKLSMDELQLRPQVERNTTSKLEVRMSLPGFHALVCMAFVLAGSFEELARRIEEARRG